MAGPNSNTAPVKASTARQTASKREPSPEPLPTDLIPLRAVCELLGVHPNTARKWSSGPDAILTCYRLGKYGHRRWSKKAVLALAHGESEEPTRAVLIYCRVSSRAQSSNTRNGREVESDLDRQVERMTAEAKSRYPEVPLVVMKETGSGMNFERKILNRFLDEVLLGKWDGSVLLLENKDRLVRFAAPLIEKILKSHNVNIIYTGQIENSATEDFTADILACIHYFSTKYYGSRSAERRRKGISAELIERAVELMDSGLGLYAIVDLMNKEGFRTEDGSILTYNILRNRIYVNRGKLCKSSGVNSAKQWKEQFIETGTNVVLPVNAAYQHYSKWAETNGLFILTKRQFAGAIKRASSYWNSDTRKNCSGWLGLKVKGASIHRTANAKEKDSVDLLIDFSDSIKGLKTDETEIYGLYRKFCKEKQIAPVTREKLVNTLRALGWQVDKGKTHRILSRAS